MINKDMISHLSSIVSNNTDITKELNSGRNLVARYYNRHELIHVLMEPDDNVILQVLREVHQFHKNIRYYRASGHLRTKGTIFKKFRV